jgi:hypothetical protein
LAVWGLSQVDDVRIVLDWFVLGTWKYLISTTVMDAYAFARFMWVEVLVWFFWVSFMFVKWGIMAAAVALGAVPSTLAGLFMLLLGIVQAVAGLLAGLFLGARAGPEAVVNALAEVAGAAASELPFPTA